MTPPRSFTAASLPRPLVRITVNINIFVVIVTIIIVWYLKKRSSRREIIDKNDQYGHQDDYYEYEKDDYNTKVTDSNYMYDGDMKDADEYESD